ncbi:MAG: hypothetical protein NC390_05705 [Fusobacterium sp.]|nr:hypothetical protein [Fusobacterium sp.]
MVNRIEEKRGTQTYARKSGAPAPKKKTLNDIMKAGRRQANAAKRTAAETQDFLKWALQNCKNQGDLDAIRDLIQTNGTPKQRKAFEKMEYDLKKAAKAPQAPVAEAPQAPVEDSKKARRAEIAKERQIKLENKENFRQAMLNAESAEDLKALEKEYGKKFTGSLKSTYNARMHAFEKATTQQAAQHAEIQTAYDKLFGYGNGKHPSNTQLGTAQPTSSKGMTWAKYAEEHGGTYTKPVSNVAHADRLAEEAIARNKQHAEMQKVYEELFGEKPVVSEATVEKTPVNNPPKPPVAEPPIEKPPVSEPPVNKPPKSPVEPPTNKPPKAPKGKGFKLGKKGKFALAALALGAIGAGIAYLAKSKKAAPTTPSGEVIKPGLVPVDSAKVEKTVTPIDEIEQKVVSEIPRDAETGKYIVKKGDNCWNIAKAELIKEKGGEIPTDAEVLERTYKIIKDNTLHFEKDNYTVLIYPNDTLNIKM